MVRSPEGPPPTTPEPSASVRVVVGRPAFDRKEYLAKFILVEWKTDRWIARVETEQTIIAEGATSEIALANLLSGQMGEAVLQEIAKQLIIRLT